MIVLQNCECISRADAGSFDFGAAGIHIEAYNAEVVSPKVRLDPGWDGTALYFKAKSPFAKFSMIGGLLDLTGDSSGGIASRLAALRLSYGGAFYGIVNAGGAKITVDISGAAVNHYGALIEIDRGDYHNLAVDMKNAGANDIGIRLAAGTTGSTGNENVITNAGSDIEDLGTDNKINTVDGGQWA